MHFQLSGRMLCALEVRAYDRAPRDRAVIARPIIVRPSNEKSGWHTFNVAAVVDALVSRAPCACLQLLSDESARHTRNNRRVVELDVVLDITRHHSLKAIPRGGNERPSDGRVRAIYDIP